MVVMEEYQDLDPDPLRVWGIHLIRALMGTRMLLIRVHMVTIRLTKCIINWY